MSRDMKVKQKSYWPLTDTCYKRCDLAADAKSFLSMVDPNNVTSNYVVFAFFLLILTAWYAFKFNLN